MTKNKRILVFGGGHLQKYIIQKCKNLGIYTVVIDPDSNAITKNIADSFYCVHGNDFELTCKIVEKHNIQGIITAATDKTLSMMARVAEKYNFPFFSSETAEVSTNKFLMKERFIAQNIPCANGSLINKKTNTDKISTPTILKPVDNSGSRGVILCNNKSELKSSIVECFKHTKCENILLEEYLTGKEYSIESIHSNFGSKVIAITEKITSNPPYNVELGHFQPANLSNDIIYKIENIIEQVANSLMFKNCCSHIELKIHNNEISIIEASPRLGGDYITSHLTELSTGYDIESALIHIALGIEYENKTNFKKNSAISYFNFTPGKINKVNIDENKLKELNIKEFLFNLKEGDHIPPIKSSLDRYGFYILQYDNKKELELLKEKINSYINIDIE